MFEEDVKPTLEYRRKTITPRPNARINLWTIMKNCIGKELTKIPMPVSKRERECVERMRRVVHLIIIVHVFALHLLM